MLADGANLVVHLAPAGAPVVAPSPDAPAVVHEHRGVPVTFWTFVPDAGDPLPDAARLGAMLADLHAALRSCDVDLPFLAPLLQDVPSFLDRAARTGTPPPRDVDALRAAFERLTAGLPAAPAQPLHGDAHPGNLLAGPVWCDFEDTCRGPVAWDLPRCAGRRASTARPPCARMRERREQRPTTTRSRRGSPFATCT